MLTNPLNVTLLSSQLLAAQAIWDHCVDLQTCRRILSVFNTAAVGILQNEASDEPRAPYTRRGLDREAWVKAVINGADEKSPRWRHMLLLGGVLLGFEGQNRQGLSQNLRGKVESALVRATQLALEEKTSLDGIGGYSMTMVLNYTFELLSDWHRTQINYDRLLPLMLHATFFSSEGLGSAYFVGAIDRDVVPSKAMQKFEWPSTSTTYQNVKDISSRPLIASLGPLSRLIAHAMENVADPNIVSDGMGSINDFVRTLLVQWRQNKLSEVDISEEKEFLDPDSLKSTIPDLWRLLRSIMFSAVIILRAVLGRVLNDRVLAAGSSKFYISLVVCPRLTVSSGTIHRSTVTAYSTKPIFYNFAHRSEFINPVFVCEPCRHRYSSSISRSSREFLADNQAHRIGSYPATSFGALPRSFFPKHLRAFRVGTTSSRQ